MSDSGVDIAIGEATSGDDSGLSVSIDLESNGSPSRGAAPQGGKEVPGSPLGGMEFANGDVGLSEDAVLSGDPQDIICHLLRRRLLDLRSAECHEMQIRPHLQGLQDRLHQLVMDTISKGQNASVLLLGERGVGKSLMVERALAGVLLDRKGEDPSKSPIVGIVRLSGLVHADDRMAFQEIAMQLCRIFSLEFVKSASVDENIIFMRNILGRVHRCVGTSDYFGNIVGRSGLRTITYNADNNTVIFVLDEFDLFARSQKQRVLYNLLDALQETSVKAAVIGVTVRHDALELLEKRVVSRFSHRTWLVLKPQGGQEGDSPADILHSMLTLPPQLEPAVAGFNASVDKCLRSPKLEAELTKFSFMGCVPGVLANVALSAAGFMAVGGTAEISEGHLMRALVENVHSGDGQAHLISDLSIPELWVLVACYKLSDGGGSKFNFEVDAMLHMLEGMEDWSLYKTFIVQPRCPDEPQNMAFRRYSTDVRDGPTMEKYEKGLMEQAFQNLQLMALIVPDDRGDAHGRCLPGLQTACLNVTRQEIDAGLAQHRKAPSQVRGWLNGSIQRMSTLQW